VGDLHLAESSSYGENTHTFKVSVHPEYFNPIDWNEFPQLLFSNLQRESFVVQEGRVPVGQTQRRPGLHIEQPGAIIKGGEMITYGDPEYEILAWGMGHVCEEGIPIGGIYMSSSVTGSSAVWPVQVSTPGEVADAHGGIEHMRGHLGVPRVLEANQLCWFTDRTPHEALPLETPKHNPGAKFVYRQFFRLVAGPISVWYSKHNTPNPLGVLPDAPISDDDKFADRH
jgi:hypothetical protein